MVNIPREGFLLLLKLGHAVLKSEDATEAPETAEKAEALVSPTVDPQSEPMKAYWQSDILEQESKNQPFIDLYLKDVALNRIPDTTEKPVKESHYKFGPLSLVYLPDSLKNLDINAVPEVPKAGSGISNSGQNPSVVVGIVIGIVTGVIIIGGLIAAVLYKHYVHHNVTSMNFDNPVYRKTTEDQFALEKNGYAPGSKLYPSTVGEEAQEPLNTPGTNDFV